MASAGPHPAKKGKKSLDSELNLVPFIDLLSCLIAFLLITAVWTQISAVPAHSTGNLTVDKPPPEKDATTIPIRVVMSEKGFTLTQASDVTEIAKSNQNGRVKYDTARLTEVLKATKARYPMQKAVTVAPEDSVKYEDVAETMDQIHEVAELPDIVLTPAT